MNGFNGSALPGCHEFHHREPLSEGATGLRPRPRPRPTPVVDARCASCRCCIHILLLSSHICLGVFPAWLG